MNFKGEEIYRNNSDHHQGVSTRLRPDIKAKHKSKSKSKKKKKKKTTLRFKHVDNEEVLDGIQKIMEVLLS